ncbi:leucine-rich repeat extensin-like protein 5 [Panicum miliaceum]|uniref:Leucine-rich repeat extensin-like protein 5 n=1 Tax=Panicum miliaceum TaxID=4540 RepID=A0A3L6SFB3_PANMI|nr:leucine-rich repeat extensin-like protein 5 [Panicum miliaceum]
MAAMAMALEPFFLTPPPALRHLAELRIEPAHSAVAFSAPCAADAGRKRRCLLPASSVRKRMLLELAPFDPAPSAPPPPPTPSPTPPPSPMASRAGSSTAAEFSFAPGLRPIQPTTAAGNMFAFAENAPMTPGRSETSGAGNMFAFLAAPERSNTPTGPTSRGGFVFAASPEGPLTPTSRGSNTSGLSFLASPNQPLTPTGPIASGRQPSLMPTGSGGASASLLSPKPARTGAADSGSFAVVPSGPALAPIGSTSSAVAKETTLPTVGLPTPSFVFSASRSPPLPRGGSKKRRRPNLRIETVPRRMSPRQWEEETPPQLTPPPQKLAKTNSSDNGEASRSGIMSGPCCLFVTSLAKAAKQEAKKASSEASRSPAGSHWTSPARRSSLEKPSKPEREVEVSSASCSGAEVVVRVTCKCGIHKEFSFDHRP